MSWLASSLLIQVELCVEGSYEGAQPRGLCLITVLDRWTAKEHKLFGWKSKLYDKETLSHNNKHLLDHPKWVDCTDHKCLFLKPEIYSRTYSAINSLSFITFVIAGHHLSRWNDTFITSYAYSTMFFWWVKSLTHCCLSLTAHIFGVKSLIFVSTRGAAFTSPSADLGAHRPLATESWACHVETTNLEESSGLSMLEGWRLMEHLRDNLKPIGFEAELSRHTASGWHGIDFGNHLCQVPELLWGTCFRTPK